MRPRRPAMPVPTRTASNQAVLTRPNPWANRLNVSGPGARKKTQIQMGQCARLLQVGQPKYCFGLGALRCLPTCHTGGLLSRSQYGASATELMASKQAINDTCPNRACDKVMVQSPSWL